MTGLERILAAFSPSGTPEFPVVVGYPGIYNRDHFTQLTDLPWWQEHDPRPDKKAEVIAALYRGSGIDWFELWQGADAATQAAVTIEPRADGVFRVDARTGQTARLEPPVVSGSLHVLRDEAPVYDDLARYLEDRVRISEPFTAVDPARMAQPQQTIALLDGLCPLGYASTSLWGLAGLVGHEAWFEAMASDPEPLYAAARRALYNTIQWVKAQAATGCRVIWIEDCLTDQIGPERIARYHVPMLQELTQAIRDAGMFSIHYFCGNPWPAWDLLLETGADALSLEESKKNFAIDIDEVVARMRGRMTILGNLDTVEVLETWPSDRLRAEIDRQLAAGRRNGNRFIMSTGSPVTPATTVERVREYVAMARGES